MLSYYIILNTLIKIFDVLLFIKIDHENQNKKYDKKISPFFLFYYNLKGFFINFWDFSKSNMSLNNIAMLLCFVKMFAFFKVVVNMSIITWACGFIM